jgi:Methyltransferase small domain
VTGVIGRPSPPAPPQVDQSVLTALYSALERADFTVERIEGALGTGQISAVPGEFAIHRRRLVADDPFSVLARMFVLGDPVDEGPVAEALGPSALDRLAAIGLLWHDDKGVRATVRLLPHGDYYLASDLAAIEESADWVAGIHSPSITLAKLAVRRPVAAALDLGTGCGIQALLAAKHSTRVVATDLNRRALDFARFNAALNGIDVIDFRSGDLFEPVDAERFDLLVANPPYVISPDATYTYRDSGLPRDELCRTIVQTAPGHLVDGGFAHILVSWACRAARPSAPRSRFGIGSATAATRGSCTTRPKIRSRTRLAGSSAGENITRRVRGRARPLARLPPPVSDRGHRLWSRRPPPAERRVELGAARRHPDRPARARERAHPARFRG